LTQEFTAFMPRDRQLFDRSMGELLAAFVRRRWPRDTAKHVSRSWDIEPSTATNLIKGHASERTISKALRAEGWPLLMALGEAMTGQAYQEFLQDITDEAARAAQQAAADQDHLRRLEARAGRLVALLDGPGASAAGGGDERGRPEADGIGLGQDSRPARRLTDRPDTT
jgi:hypothetical protein